MDDALSRREFLGGTAGAVLAAGAEMPEKSAEVRMSLGEMTEDEQMEWLLGALNGRDLMAVAYDDIVKNQAAVIRDTSVPLPTRMQMLREMFDHSLTLSEVQQPHLHAAHEKYGVGELLLGRDPIFFRDDAIRRWWKRESLRLRDRCAGYENVHEQRQIISGIVQALLAHKESESGITQTES